MPARLRRACPSLHPNHVRATRDAGAWLVLAVAAAACVQEPQPGPNPFVQPEVSVAEDSLGGDDLGRGVEDTGTGAEVAAEVASPGDTGSVSDTGSVKDTGGACTGAAGCACTENGQCDSGFCLDQDGSAVCAQTCTGGCPVGSACKTVGAGSDTVSICLPKFPRLCEPCSADSDCHASGNTTALCIAYGDDKQKLGGFCGGSCDDQNPCPTGYTCAGVVNQGGATVKQCKKTDNTCECSPRAKKLGLFTSCGTTNALGTCTGKRSCGEKGLSACSAGAPVGELCDGVDNDCNGKTDESAACDDKNSCTNDVCDPLQKKCTHAPTSAPCDDGNSCTSSDACVAGVCTGKGKNCDDGNPCTEDTCAPGGGCKYVDEVGPCVSDNPCVTGAQCKEGQCQGGKAKVCNDNNPCTADSCDSAGKCQNKAVPSACDDGNACTSGDACDGGACAGKPKVCDDKNPCTDDTCDPGSTTGGCKNTASPGACDDGNACTQKDFCQAGSCAGQPLKCDDGKACTNDSCDAAKGCVNTVTTGSCDDGNPCTQGESCSGGLCQGGQAPKCDDANPCTSDACSPTAGCTYTANNVSCDDGDVCTTGDKCAASKCVGGANTCGCKSQADCDATANPNLCLGKLVCDQSKAPYKCVPDAQTAVTCSTAQDGQCKKTACDAKTGKCAATFINEGGPCNDGSSCTNGDVCGGGACKPGVGPNCDDKNGCTIDSCDPTKGCAHAATTGACDDGDPCTKNDSCATGTCKGTGGAGCCTKDTDCNDNNACTKDSCNASSGACTNDAAAMNGGACDADGNGCTQGDACSAGKCAAGKAVVCAGDACNDGTCSSTGATTSTCKKTPKATGSLCDDGQFCTEGEACDSAGACKGGKPKDCAGSGCTAGTCNESTKKCEGLPKADGASCNADSSGCTKGDSCKGGVCVAGLAADCANPFDTCNLWTCNPTGVETYQCVPKPKAKDDACDDGKFCTGGDKCDGAGKCVPGPTTDCQSAGNACNDGTCDETAKKCVAKPKADGAPCNDGDSCTGTDACKTGLCLGTNNACGDFKVSTFKPMGGGAGDVRRPHLSDLGGGQFRAFWASSPTLIQARGFREDWSRLYTETQVTSAAMDLTDLSAITLQTGGHGLYYATFAVSSQSCQYAACNWCTGQCGSYFGSSYCYTNKTRWYFGHSLNALKSTALLQDLAIANLADKPSTCYMADPNAASQKISSLAMAGFADGKRFTVHTTGSTNYKAIRNADNGMFKDIGTDTAMKNYDVATFSDGGSILVWDDGANIQAQMYASNGDKNGVQFKVNTNGGVNIVTSSPRVATMPNGRYVIAWNTGAGGGDVAAQVYKQDPGSPLGTELLVNTTTSGSQQWPYLAVYQDGSFVVAYEDASGKDGSGYGILGQWFTSTGAKVGGEKVVNAGTPGDQRYHSAIGLTSDEAVVAWVNQADGQIYARRFDKQGNVLNGSKEFLVNATKVSEQADPALAVAADNSFIAAWDSDKLDGDGAGIAVQRFGADGLPVGAELVANTTKASQQLHPAVGIDKAGNFVVVWDSFDQDGDLEGIYGQRFKSDGSKVGPELAINQFKTNEQQKPTLAVQPSGKFAVAWESFGTTGGASYDVILRCYDESGNATGNEKIVNTTTTDKQTGPVLAPFPDGSGKYVLVWQSYGEDGSDYGVYAQLLFDCSKIGEPFLVNTTKAGEQSQPRVAVNAAGTFTVTWRSAGQDGSSFGVYAQAFDKNGAKIGNEYKVNAVTADEQSRPAVAYLADGKLALTWQTVGEDESGLAIKVAVRNDTAQVGLDWHGNTTHAGSQTQPIVVARPNGTFVVVWTSTGQDGDKGSIVGRIFK